jgi:hypothetical protein
MPGKPKSRNWNDVQTAISMVAIVTTLGLWNLFSTAPKAVKTAGLSEPVLPPPTEPPVEDQAVSIAPGGPVNPTPMPQVKIMFTPGVTQAPVVQQQVQQVQQPARKKKNRNNSSGGVSSSVTQTKSS